MSDRVRVSRSLADAAECREEEMNTEHAQPPLSRRKLLAALGATGAAIVAGGVYRDSLPRVSAMASVQESVYGPGCPETDGCCEAATVEQLRQHPAPEAGRVYLVTDRGREGRFYYDASDGMTPDNAGTVLVTAAGARFKRVYDGAVNVRWFGAKGDGTADDTAAIRAALEAGAGQSVYLPRGTYLVTETLVVPAGTSLSGDGTEDAWGETAGIGTVVRNSGPGTPARWTDIDGADRTDFKPLLVFGGNEVSLSRLSLVCDPTNRWDAAVFVPSVKRCSIDQVDTSGPWREAGLYLDATWSSTNATLSQLHPEVASSTGMNEFSASNCYLRGLWAVKVQGTTRNPDDYPGAAFVWGWGGTSDLSFMNCRLGSDSPASERVSDGGCYKHDAAIGNAARAGQGHNFVNCTFRTASKYMILLDRSNRDTFVNCYGETIASWANAGNPAARFEVTSRTGYVCRVNDHINAPVYANDQLYSGSAGQTEWSARAKIATMRYDGRMLMPNIVGIPAANQALKLRSYYLSDTLNGVIHFRHVDGDGSDAIFADIAKERLNLRAIPLLQANGSLTLQSTELRVRNSQSKQDVLTVNATGDVDVLGSLTPMAGSNGTIGLAAQRWEAVHADELRLAGQCRFLTGTGSPEGNVAADVGSVYTRSDGGPGTTLYVKESGSGTAGWVAK